MKCQIPFSRKNKNNISKFCLLKFLQSVNRIISTEHGLTFDCEYEILATSSFLIYCHTHILAMVTFGHIVHGQVMPVTIFCDFIIF